MFAFTNKIRLFQSWNGYFIGQIDVRGRKRFNMFIMLYNARKVLLGDSET